jgi:RNA polymerase sigma-70 factor (ECF subfamily)
VVAAVLAGDRDAYRVLVDREAASLIRACQRVLGDPHEAEDVAQEAFLMAFRALADWRGDGPFGAWLSRIGVRIALRRVAGRRRLTWLDPARATDAPGSASGVEPGRSGDVRAAEEAGADPAAHTIRAERTVELRTAVARLAEPYREVVALRFFGERSLAEIALATGRPVPTVKTHLRRGLLRLRATIEDPRT